MRFAPTRYEDENSDRPVLFNRAWSKAPRTLTAVRNVQRVAEVNNYKGEVLHASSSYGPVPRAVLTSDAKQVVLASGPIKIAGSFAPTVDDAGFTHIPTYDSDHLFYDGTNGSRIIVKRRADGFKDPLPPGDIEITNLPSGAPGGDAPEYYMFPFSVPGACHIGWVPGDIGTPRFMHKAVTNDAIAAQRSRGREALTDGPLVITLLPVPAPEPPPIDPGGTPSSGTGGTITLTVTTPANNATVYSAAGGGFNLHTDMHDTTHPLDMLVIYEVGGQPLWSIKIVSGLDAVADALLALAPGTHNLDVHLTNNIGNAIDVFLTLNVIDPPPPPPPPIDPTPVDPPPILRSCVMKGTEIVAIGNSQWWTAESMQNEWFRMVTDSGRELMATPDHPIYTSRAGRTEMRDVRKGDLILTVLGEERVADIRPFQRPGVKVSVHMDAGHLFWANGVLSHNKMYRE